MSSSVVLLLYSKPRKHDQVLFVLQYYVSDEHADTEIIDARKSLDITVRKECQLPVDIFFQ